MARIISFGNKKALEYIPDMKEKLLDGTKSQTIRKIRKKPFKVGEKVQIYWKQRAKKQYTPIFLREAIKLQRKSNKGEYANPILFDSRYYKQIDGSEKLFDAEITEIIPLRLSPHKQFREIAVRDGFKNRNDLEHYLGGTYPLTPYNHFEVIRWRRIDG